MVRAPAPSAAVLVTALGLALGLGATLTGCGSGAEPAPVTGVDTLTIPTPSPDPDDFVDVVDNPWLPLVPGTVATFRPDTGTLTPTVAELVVTVEDGPTVAGVTTTAVRRSYTPEQDGAAAGERGPVGSSLELEPTVDLYAQDVAGNVWWLGREGEWLAGEDGAQAGLAMPAEPRRGDGYREALGPDLDVRSRVVRTGTEVDVPAGTFGDVVVIETRVGERVVRYSYAEGAGPVEIETTEGDPDVRLGLVEIDEPQSG